jgi:hypothetical protein
MGICEANPSTAAQFCVLPCFAPCMSNNMSNGKWGLMVDGWSWWGLSSLLLGRLTDDDLLY